jgi:hypothetical protein
MKKMLTLFERNFSNNGCKAMDRVTPGAEWVVTGEGVATQKIDGACCMIRDGILYKRYDAKKGKMPPEGFEPCEAAPDPVTGHWPGWLKVGDGPEDRWFKDARSNMLDVLPDGTYEATGPKFQGNPEKLAKNFLVPHGGEKLSDAPRDFEGLKEYLRDKDIEGIVWHHPDGRMVKIKKSDFFGKR